MPKTLTPEIALAAIAGLELQKTQIDSQIAELRNVLDGGRLTSSAAMPSDTSKGKRKKFISAWDALRPSFAGRYDVEFPRLRSKARWVKFE